ncbi:hypothetical protein VTO42DRAFT_2089 [Malbranchea cinnamomea]
MNAPLQANYRGYPQTTHRSPAAAARRPMQAPPGMMPVPLAQQGIPNPQTITQRAHPVPNPAEVALRQSRKPTDKNLPDGIDETVIGEGVQHFKRLREVEQKLDAVMLRKRLEIQDSINRNVKRYRTMRIWISNTVENQPWQQQQQQGEEPEFNGTIGARQSAGRYRVKIEGRLLDDDEDPTISDVSESEEGEKEQNSDATVADTAAKKQKKKKKTSARPQRSRLSHFFKSITVDFDKPTTPGIADLATITWNKPSLPPNATSLPPSADFDSLEFSRVSEVNLNVTINLVRDENPERLRLSKELASLLDVEEEARGGIVVGLWEYINAMELQENEEKRAVRCDDRLKAIFNRDKIFFPQIPEGATAHTSPLEPIKLPYTIRVDQEFHTSNNPPPPTIYDIRVAVDDPVRAKMIAITTSPEFPAMLRQVSSLDDQLALIVQALHHSKARHNFFSAMGKDPVTFIKRWMNSQRRDLETILGEATRGGGEDGSGPEFRRGGANGAWDTAVAKEAVRYLLAKPNAR